MCCSAEQGAAPRLRCATSSPGRRAHTKTLSNRYSDTLFGVLCSCTQVARLAACRQKHTELPHRAAAWTVHHIAGGAPLPCTITANICICWQDCISCGPGKHLSERRQDLTCTPPGQRWWCWAAGASSLHLDAPTPSLALLCLQPAQSSSLWSPANAAGLQSVRCHASD